MKFAKPTTLHRKSGMWDTTKPTFRFSMTHLHILGNQLLPFDHPQKSLTLNGNRLTID
jgi:hypothetical protein